MPTIAAKVLRNGKPARGHRVVLSYSGLAGGMSNAEYTDSNGIAEFDADYGQEGKVYVDGSEEGHWGSYSATDVTVNL